jgi:hypothetical protein
LRSKIATPPPNSSIKPIAAVPARSSILALTKRKLENISIEEIPYKFSIVPSAQPIKEALLYFGSQKLYL